MSDSSYLTLDRDYRILSAAGAYAPMHQQRVGRCVWDDWPDGREQWLPLYEQAWRKGYAYSVFAYRGLACQVHANVLDGVLHVRVKEWTLCDLEAALLELRDALAAQREQQDVLPCAQVIPLKRREAS